MLENLTICNFLYIDKLDIEFKEGFNVLTGETGSGKSVITEAIKIAIGLKNPAKNTILNKSASFHAIFKISSSSPLVPILSESGVDMQAGELIFTRNFSEEGKSKNFINNTPVASNFIREIGKILVDFNEQGEHFTLFTPSNYLNILDNFSGLNQDSKELVKLFQELSAKRKLVDDLLSKKALREKEISYLEHIIAEIEEVNTYEGEETELLEKKKIIVENSKAKQILLELKKILSNDKDSGSVIELLINASKNISRNSIFYESNSELKSIPDKIENLIKETDEIIRIISLVVKDSNEDGLEKVQERLFTLKDLAKKHDLLNADQLINFLEKSRQDHKYLISLNEETANLQEQIKTIKQKYDILAMKISNIRKESAKILENSITEKLRFLLLDKASVRINITTDENCETARGYDNVIFEASINPDLGFSAIHKSASGGELTRILLALKLCLDSCFLHQLLIFDEIDSGVSGKASERVAKILNEVAKNKQIIVITHSAQVAAKASSHFKVSKSFANHKTSLQVNFLDEDGRINEIAKILSAEESSQEAFSLARKLIAKEI